MFKRVMAILLFLSLLEEVYLLQKIIDLPNGCYGILAQYDTI